MAVDYRRIITVAAYDRVHVAGSNKFGVKYTPRGYKVHNNNQRNVRQEFLVRRTSPLNYTKVGGSVQW